VPAARTGAYGLAAKLQVSRPMRGERRGSQPTTMVISLQHATTQIHDPWLEYWSSPHGRNEPEGFL
jgi:hypothetical protein